MDKKDITVVKERSRNIFPPPPTPEKPAEECNCKSMETLPKIKKNDQEVQALIEFENKLHDNIYVKL